MTDDMLRKLGWLFLAELPAEPWARRGIYAPPSTKLPPEEWVDLPTRMRFLHPMAARSLLHLEERHPGWRFSDMYRDATGSLRARRNRPGAKPPGWSAHNFGLAFDLAVDRTCRALGMPYRRVLEALKEAGWYCHRRDGAGGHESWHFNWLGPDPGRYLAEADPNPRTWSAVAEARIQAMYGQHLRLDPHMIRLHLHVAGHLGELAGPEPVSETRVREATAAFQREWDLVVDGVAGPITQRTLAIVCVRTRLMPP